MLDGASALAIPTSYGQSLEVVASDKEGIFWKSLDEKGGIWFEGEFRIDNKILSQAQDNSISRTLLKILQEAKKIYPAFLQDKIGWNVTTHVNFPLDWGLGTSSTLLNNIAQWAEIDPFALLKTSFNGSGYDIAAAKSKLPILYQLQNEIPLVETLRLPWDFTDQLFFVHLNQKQDSKEGIIRYRNASVTKDQIDTISEISYLLIASKTLAAFEKLLQKHEEIISEIIQLPTIKEHLFNDYSKTIKSLGAWGGDFILATGNEADQEYFRKKGYETILPFAEMIL